MAKDLSVKEIKFITAYIRTGSPAAAYREAYDCDGYESRKVSNYAYALMQRPRIKEKIEELKAKQAETMETVVETALKAALPVYSIDEQIKKAQDLHDKAVAAGRHAAAVSALTLQSKLLGYLVDKSEVELKGVNQMTEADVDVELELLRKRHGELAALSEEDSITGGTQTTH